MRFSLALFLLCSLIIGSSCSQGELTDSTHELAIRVRHDVKRSWDAYERHAWGMDVLKPLSREGYNWYDHSLAISPIDNFSALASGISLCFTLMSPKSVSFKVFNLYFSKVFSNVNALDGDKVPGNP